MTEDFQSDYAAELISTLSDTSQGNDNIQGSLEGVRVDLMLHLKELRLQLLDLINRDYADFINLSSNLAGLDRTLDQIRPTLMSLATSIQVPIYFILFFYFNVFIFQFIFESNLKYFYIFLIQNTRDFFQSISTSLETKLQERNLVREKKAILKLFLNIIGSLNRVEELLIVQEPGSDG